MEPMPLEWDRIMLIGAFPPPSLHMEEPISATAGVPEGVDNSAFDVWAEWPETHELTRWMRNAPSLTLGMTCPACEESRKAV